MPCRLRIEYLGAIDHVLARGNGRRDLCAMKPIGGGCWKAPPVRRGDTSVVSTYSSFSRIRLTPESKLRGPTSAGGTRVLEILAQLEVRVLTRYLIALFEDGCWRPDGDKGLNRSRDRRDVRELRAGKAKDEVCGLRVQPSKRSRWTERASCIVNSSSGSGSGKERR